MENVYDNVKSVVSLVPAVRTANANGTGVDTQGYSNGKVVISAGDIDLTTGDETYTFSVEDSADNSSFAAVSGLTTTVTADNQTKNIRLSNLNLTLRRYIRVVLTVAGTTPSIPVSAVLELGQPVSGPVQ